MALEGTYVHWLAVKIQPRYCCEDRTSSCCLCLTFVWYLFIDLQVDAYHLLCSSPLIPTSQTFPRSNVKLILVDLAFKPTPPFTVSINKFPSLLFFSTLLHFPAPPHLLHPSTPAQLAKRRMSSQGVRLSCLSHAICGVTLTHGVTFSTLLFPFSRDSEPRGD